MKKQTKLYWGMRFLGITLGCIVYAIGIALFFDASGLVTGGLTGIAIMIGRFFEMDTGILVLLLNIPLLIIGFFVFGRSFLFSTVYATVFSSVLISVFSNVLNAYLPLTTDLLMASLLGGALFSIGLAVIFRCGGTTGGTDIVAKLLRRRFRHLSTGKLFMAMDVGIVALSALIFRHIELALYSGIAIVIGNMLFDKVLYGLDEAKLLYVISQKPVEIRQRILSELEVGVTLLDGKGGFTGENKEVLLVVVKKHLYPKIKDIVREEDEYAFLIVTSASEVFGEGFKLSEKHTEL